MKKVTIQIDGTNTLNKGAELMLHSVVEQIRKKNESYQIIYNSNVPFTDSVGLPKKLNIQKRAAMKYGKVPRALLGRMNINTTYFSNFYALKDIDIVLDAGGFQFSDQWKYSTRKMDLWKGYYESLKKAGTKIILLPQAMGPFNTKGGIDSIEMVNRYCDIIIARETISKQHVLNAGVEPERVWCYPDFTSVTKGAASSYADYAKGKVCVIPNKKMITHVSESNVSYFEFFKNIIQCLIELGEDVFILNHEGKGDYEICKRLNADFDNRFTVISDLDALATKGVIGASKFTISSRFHGVASSLSQNVPCLSTSWNHKYEMLFSEYGITDGVLDLNTKYENLKERIRKELACVPESVIKLEKFSVEQSRKVHEMWDKVWEIVEK
ncbi:hypothetical protein DN752_21865 [Echinicola strongylocentroti]|uniref:Polysaccharide pyruvyl transferase domain-containing protein n=1 Tax=Echinicola strongylocentroti TaxID=1795355 RepID=A0A2Z4INA1_9BACT|nr:polysaccharide pyruvyl transferase family protein [Echinicola strongylocentroti]AWW32581.1 hypothetical protein DN752_21865 [Echinicola strongylocentroti]